MPFTIYILGNSRSLKVSGRSEAYRAGTLRQGVPRREAKAWVAVHWRDVVAAACAMFTRAPFQQGSRGGGITTAIRNPSKRGCAGGMSMSTSRVPTMTTWDPLKAGSYQRSMVRRTDTSYMDAKFQKDRTKDISIRASAQPKRTNHGRIIPIR